MIASLALAHAAQGSATTALYHPESQSRDFAATDGGWTHSVDYGGLCLPGVTCPQAGWGFVASGGTGGPGDGHLRVNVGPSVAGIASTVTSKLTSPEFTYRGVEGAKPESLDFSMSWRADVDALLRIAGNSAMHSVRIEPTSPEYDSVPLEPIASRSILGGEGWAPTGAISIPPDALTIGESYRIAIETELTSGIEAVPQSTADYDDVVIRARRTTPAGSNGRVTNALVRFVAQHSILARATVRRGRLQVRLRCHTAAERRCRFSRIRGMLGKGNRATNRRSLSLAAGRTRNVVLRPRSKRHLQQMRKRGRVTVRHTLRIGDRSRNVARRVNLRSR